MQTVKKAWAIIFSEYENTSNKLKAMREIREAKYQLLQTLMDSGILERHQGSLNIIHTMSAEMQKELAEVKACWKLQFGERIRPIIYQEPEEAKIIEGKKINEPTESKPDTRSPNQKILDAKSGGFIG
jgi:hypothetical protein